MERDLREGRGNKLNLILIGPTLIPHNVFEVHVKHFASNCQI